MSMDFVLSTPPFFRKFFPAGTYVVSIDDDVERCGDSKFNSGLQTVQSVELPELVQELSY